MRTNERFSVRSEGIILGLIAIMFFSVIPGRAQEQNPRQEKVREEYKARMEALENFREKYPDAWRDSLAAWTVRQKYQEALVRLNEYQNNSRIDTLETIDLSNARLGQVPDFVFAARNLRMLVLDHNRITRLPKELAELDSLRKIYWRNNEFGESKPRIQKIPQVTKLAMDGNGLEKAPNFRKLKALKILELKNNQFVEIPISKIRKNKNLRELAIGENPLKLTEARYRKIDFLKVLKVNKSGLTGFDPSMYELVNLDEWQLQENKISSIPEGISKLDKLTKFSCYKNELEKLPADFFDLARLKVVDLYFNNIKVIPKEISRLVSLEVLYLSHNEVYNVPRELGELINLRELYLHTNRISALPGTLEKLDRLKIIRVNDNYLLEFPSSILGMESIQEVDVNNNDLTTLPAEIEGLEKLTLFSFQNNEIDIYTPENAHVPYMIERMLKRGVVCLPRIYRNETEGGED